MRILIVFFFRSDRLVEKSQHDRQPVLVDPTGFHLYSTWSGPAYATTLYIKDSYSDSVGFNNERPPTYYLSSYNIEQMKTTWYWYI